MKSIFEFYDYRLYMLAFYEERKRTSAFSWRQFSKLAGFSSPNYMKVVCDGKSRLSKAGVEPVANAMGLIEHEKIYGASNLGCVCFGNAELRQGEWFCAWVQRGYFANNWI